MFAKCYKVCRVENQTIVGSVLLFQISVTFSGFFLIWSTSFAKSNFRGRCYKPAFIMLPARWSHSEKRWTGRLRLLGTQLRAEGRRELSSGKWGSPSPCAVSAPVTLTCAVCASHDTCAVHASRSTYLCCVRLPWHLPVPCAHPVVTYPALLYVSRVVHRHFLGSDEGHVPLILLRNEM